MGHLTFHGRAPVSQLPLTSSLSWQDALSLLMAQLTLSFVVELFVLCTLIASLFTCLDLSVTGAILKDYPDYRIPD